MADETSRPPTLGAPMPNDSQTAEQKMRRALGLNSGGGRQSPVQQRPEQARQRHRFVQDGGVPVVVLNHRTDETGALRERIQELEGLLENERAATAAARRAAGEQQAAIQSLETRLAHAELAHRDQLAQEQRARTVLQEQITLLQASPPPRAARAPAVTAPRADVPRVQLPRAAFAGADVPSGNGSGENGFGENGSGEDVSEEDGSGEAGPVEAGVAGPRKRGRPRIHAPKEPKPVRWWTPSFKAKTKA